MMLPDNNAHVNTITLHKGNPLLVTEGESQL